MSVVQEFRDFAVRGNVVDMGVGIVIGAAFTSIVNSFVADIVNPVLGVLTGGLDFSNLFVNLGDGDHATLAAAREAGAPTLNYGLFLNACVSFLIVSLALFVVVRNVNRLKRLAEAAPESPATPEPPAEVKLLTEIRDALRDGR